MKCFSIFSGIGGFDTAARNKGYEIVGACEIDKYAREIYTKHFPQVKIWQDARKINPKELPDFDILFGGFPCQGFSIAGHRGGFEDTRGTLFFEITRIAKEKRPRYLFLENVRGLLNHKGGDTMRTIIKALDEVGYDAEWQVINSKYFVPQNRERVFIIGHSRDYTVRQIFPIGFNNQVYNGTRQAPQRERQRIQEQHSKNITSPHTATLIYISQKNSNMKQRIQEKEHSWCLGTSGNDFGILEKEPQLKPLNDARQGYRVYDKNGIGQCLNAQAGGLGAKMGLVHDDRIVGCLDANYHKGGGTRTMVELPSDCEPAPKTNIYNGRRIRRLTPLECERLQGFKDFYTEGLSDTQRYKTLGNAVTVPVIEYILDHLN